MGRLITLLERILAELEYLNSHNRQLEERVKALESQDQVLSVIEAANYVGKTRQTIHTWTEQGRIKMVERAGKRGYLLSELKTIKHIKP